jgi:SAM-dependent methyltransferase
LHSHPSGAPDKVFVVHSAVLADLGCPVVPGKSILDLGCGDGRFVRYMRRSGHDAYGADLEAAYRNVEAEMQRSGEIGAGGSPFRQVDLRDYSLPFADNSFDFVISNEVFEHVAEYGATFTEVRRVMRPGGASLHFFPGRYTPVEQHAFVPLATLVRAYPWLYLWALLGVRNEHQKGLSAREVASLNATYLKEHTFYPTRRAVERIVKERFDNCSFVEKVYLRHGFGRSRHLKSLISFLPFGPYLFSQFRVRALFFRKETTSGRAREVEIAPRLPSVAKPGELTRA